MKRPILAYGHSILKQKSSDIDDNYPNLKSLIADMWETMHNAYGCGLAAAQLGIPIRLFIVDSKTTYEQLDEDLRAYYFEANDKGVKQTFINATIIHRSAEEWEDEEGCLSIPNISYKVKRSWDITMHYYDENFKEKIQTFYGATARMIQHEYDHTEGILYFDYLQPISKRLFSRQLNKIIKGKVQVPYRMKFI
jgi:peptide deformylase